MTKQILPSELSALSCRNTGLSIGDLVTYKVGSEYIPAVITRIRGNGDIIATDCAVSGYKDAFGNQKWKISEPMEDVISICFRYHEDYDGGLWCARGVSKSLGRSGVYRLYSGHYCNVHGC